MPCAKCGSSAPFANGRCQVCGTPAPLDEDDGAVTSVPLSPDDGGMTVAPTSAVDDATVLLPTSSGAPAPPPTGSSSSIGMETGSTAFGTAAVLKVGEDFGERYHIIRVLGAGGMGAVYQAWDKILEAAVAIKVIRPEAAANPEEAEAHREALQARVAAGPAGHPPQRRSDPRSGAMDGITYITMPVRSGLGSGDDSKKKDAFRPSARCTSPGRWPIGLAAAHEAGSSIAISNRRT